jgi:hypothetical protein
MRTWLPQSRCPISQMRHQSARCVCSRAHVPKSSHVNTLSNATTACRAHHSLAHSLGISPLFFLFVLFSLADLVKNHVAPDPNHGIDFVVPAATVRASGLLSGNHTVTIRGWPASDPRHSQPPIDIGSGAAKCVTDGRVDQFCGGPPEPESWFCCKSRRKGQRPTEPAPPILPNPYPLPPSSRPAPGKASVVLFITDDQDLMLGSLHVMNRTKALFADGGATFENFFVTTPICCPSRISLLSGRWAHNSGAVATTPAGCVPLKSSPRLQTSRLL